MSRPLNPWLLVALTSLWLAGPGNIALWLALWRIPAISGWEGLVFGFAFFSLIAGLQAAFLSLFAWRATLKPMIAFCLVAAALGANFMLTYGIVIDPSMMINVMQTDVREASELFSPRLLLTLFLLAVLPLWWLWRLDVERASLWVQLRRNLLLLGGAALVVLLAAMLSYQSLVSTMRNHKQLRFMVNPLNSVYALGRVAQKKFAQPALPQVKIGEDARHGPSWQPGAKPPLLILVVGETARAANFSLNGYERLTNPELAKENVTSFLHVHACGTSTAASVPCMFSHLGREAYGNRKADYENLLDVLKHAGLGVLWRDNNAGCKDTCEGVTYDNMAQEKPPELCGGKECFDEVLLRHLDSKLESLPGQGAVLVLHQMGSHGPAYYLRSPKDFKKFMPECETNVLQDCTREQVVNAYDNTILYTDYFLARTIDWLKARSDHYDTAMLYVSDHGESLGENNTYLHGLPYILAPDVQKHVPMVLWLSPQMEQRRGITTACLQGQRKAELSHDNLFHSVLGLLDIQTSVYRPELDLFRDCSTRP